MKKHKKKTELLRKKLLLELIGTEQCKRCGEKHLHWDKIGSNWKLLNQMDEIHICKWD